MNGTAAKALHGLHAVVTGGGRGIGAVIAAALADLGADITLMGRTASTIEAHAETLRQSAGVRAQAIVCDVTQPEAVRRAFAGASAKFGVVAILVNNAGQAEAASFEDITVESWRRMIDVNLTGTFLCTQQVLEGMLAARSGRIVNVASVAGLAGASKIAAYCAAKHGVVGLTRALAAETARQGITVNAVCPGYTEDTDMFSAAIEGVMRSTGESEGKARSILAKRSPRGVLTTPQEVADAVIWLCSPGASAITGQAIAVAGGEIMP
jgi:NAD(P)-dependent dehydrogenase (short-subunit alcohol dehydrogenase family)